jgi:hypothetical protein
MFSRKTMEGDDVQDMFLEEEPPCVASGQRSSAVVTQPKLLSRLLVARPGNEAMWQLSGLGEMRARAEQGKWRPRRLRAEAVKPF